MAWYGRGLTPGHSHDDCNHLALVRPSILPIFLPTLNKTQSQHNALRDGEIWVPWWRHPMETFSALPALCEWNPPVTGGFPSQRPATRALMFYLICAWTNGWANNPEVTIMTCDWHMSHTYKWQCVVACKTLSVSGILSSVVRCVMVVVMGYIWCFIGCCSTNKYIYTSRRYREIAP